MNKNKKIIYGITASLAVVTFSICYAVLNNKPEQTDQVTLSSAKKSSSSSTVENSTTEESSSTSEERFLIANHTKEILRNVEKLNDFSQGSKQHYEEVKKSLSELHVSLDDNTKAMFGMFDNSGVVISGIVLDNKIEPDGSNYKITFTARTAKSGNSNGDDAASKVAAELRKKLSDDEYEKFNQTVIYSLTVSEDGGSAVLKLESGQWW